jgi:hypothetical protein
MKIKKQKLAIKITLPVVLGLLISGSLFFLHKENSSSAADARLFNAGNIMSDYVMTNKNSMSETQIQTFLNSKVSCDHWGVKKSELGEGTRAQYAQNRGWPLPFECLNTYKQDGETAAHIIWQAAQDYNINPQVLIVLLQKEQSLVTDEWPGPHQYRAATGYGCPDTAACDSQYYGFKNQVRNAAKFFNAYQTGNTAWYKLVWPDNNYTGVWRQFTYNIKWHPDNSCGASPVWIENRATASLYSYTPYRPNAAALNAGYGLSSEYCSSYGNRNFYLYFTDWFGNTAGSVGVTSGLVVSSGFSQAILTNKPITVSFKIKNSTSQRIDIGKVGVGVRDEGDKNYDFGMKSVVLDPQQEYVYSATTNVQQEGKYSFFIINYRDGNGWSETYPESSNSTIMRRLDGLLIQNAPTVIQGPIVDNINLHVGQTSAVRFEVKNNSKYAVDLGSFGLAVRAPSGKNVDVGFDKISSLSSGNVYSYHKSFTPKESGIYKTFVSSTGDGGKTWSEATYPIATGSSNNRLDIVVKPSATLTQGLTTNASSYRVGDVMTGAFAVKNFGNSPVAVNKKLCYIMRSPSNKNYDLGCLNLTTLQPSQEQKFTGSIRLSESGTYRAYFSTYDSAWRDNTWIFAKEIGDEVTSLTFVVK